MVSCMLLGSVGWAHQLFADKHLGRWTPLLPTVVININFHHSWSCLFWPTCDIFWPTLLLITAGQLPESHFPASGNRSKVDVARQKIKQLMHEQERAADYEDRLTRLYGIYPVVMETWKIHPRLHPRLHPRYTQDYTQASSSWHLILVEGRKQSSKVVMLSMDLAGTHAVLPVTKPHMW